MTGLGRFAWTRVLGFRPLLSDDHGTNASAAARPLRGVLQRPGMHSARVSAVHGQGCSNVRLALLADHVKKFYNGSGPLGCPDYHQGSVTPAFLPESPHQ